MVMFGWSFWYSSKSPTSLNPKVPNRPTVSVVGPLGAAGAAAPPPDPHAARNSAPAVARAAAATVVLRGVYIGPPGHSGERSHGRVSRLSPSGDRLSRERSLG